MSAGADLVGIAAPATAVAAALSGGGTLTAEVVSVTTFSAEVSAVVLPANAVPRNLVKDAALQLALSLGASMIHDIIDPHKVIATHARGASDSAGHRATGVGHHRGHRQARVLLPQPLSGGVEGVLA